MHACATPAALAPSARLRYGAWAVPLAFAALPLYVHWPAHMAAQPGWNLAALGGLLLAVRVIDAALDPWIGQRLDRLGERGHDWLPRLGLGGAALMGAGWSALFLLDWPPGAAGWSLAALALLLTSLGYSVAQLAQQAWGVQLAQAESQAGPDHAAEAAQVRWVSARELGALAGVLVASLLPALAGWPATVALWWLLAGLAAWALLPLRSVASAPWSAPVRAAALVEARVPPHTLPRAWVGPLLVQLVSGIASAVPSALVLLVVGDVLGGGPSLQALALLLYFGSAAAALPLASRAVQRWGAARAWSLGMGAAALAFLPFGMAPTPAVFLLMCLLTGAALALETLAGQTLWIARLEAGGAAQRARGFGWWALVNKSTLALAAGLALPLAHALGYRAAQGDAAAHDPAALLAVYVGLPVAFKLAAAALWALPRHRKEIAA